MEFFDNLYMVKTKLKDLTKLKKLTKVKNITELKPITHLDYKYPSPAGPQRPSDKEEDGAG